ncbi:MAG: repressor LexA [Desulfuromonadales bacterium GWD2_61_12]|nr:MAG: repressor LexA [Desulfuromonadales bacterium GWC2_61_20]OGR35503.1 MAG: repressor LexA [Desulfuromonadales bacterium GWD2_61_12]HAD03419.1 LexA family transcriptional regulator [Desulfuromonas sp.]HBT84207.1 LexA family transcriptional regulator [Desulfuromonas sp.]
MPALPPRQQQVLDCIGTYLARHGYPPTLRDIAAALDISGTLGVMKHLAALEKKGYLRRSGDSRGIVLLGRDTPAPPPGLPVVGSVRAGQPEPAIEEIEDYFSVDASLLRSGGRFFLKVKGDSMLGAAICDGDLALIRPQPDANDGDIVVALIDGEATLKRFFRQGESIRLQPENPTLAPIIVPHGSAEVTVVGKVVAICRRLG